jgi:hypothetical protein
MQVYTVRFENGSCLSLMAYSHAQASALAESIIPFSPIASVIALGPFDR